MLEPGDKVSIGFNAMPEAEKKRLEAARSGPRSKVSKVIQGNHQTEPETGVIEEKRENIHGVSYLVRINAKNSVAGRLRVI